MTAVTREGKRRRQRAREVARRGPRMKGRAEERHLSGGTGGGRGDNGGIEKRARERGGKIWLHLAWELAPLPVVHEEIETQKPRTTKSDNLAGVAQSQSGRPGGGRGDRSHIGGQSAKCNSEQVGDECLFHDDTPAKKKTQRNERTDERVT